MTEGAKCHVCKRFQRQELRGSIKRVIEDDSGFPEETFLYQLFECGGCGSGNLAIEIRSGGGASDGETEYFPRVARRETPDWLNLIDRSIAAILREVYIAITNDANTLAVLGARTIIDRMIQDRVGDQGSFQKGLAKMKAEGHITAKQLDILKIAVNAGHAAAHRGHSFGPSQVESLMNIVEHLIELFYVVEDEAQTLKANTPARPPRKQKVEPRRGPKP